MRWFAFLGATAAMMLVALPAFAENYALLIGIDTYEDSARINTLSGASADAEGLGKALIEVAKFPAENVVILTSRSEKKPTRILLLRELERLKRRIEPGDNLFVFFAGHGYEADGVPYVLPYDTDLTSTSLLKDSALPTEKFREYLRGLPVKLLILAFDMCRVEPNKTGRTTVEANVLTDKLARGLDLGVGEKASDGKSVGPQIIAQWWACSPGQRSYEWQSKARGYFSYFLEQGLRGAASTPGATVTLADLRKYVGPAVEKAVRVDEAREQTPRFSLDGPTDADSFALVAGNAPAPVPVVPVASSITNLINLALQGVTGLDDEARFVELAAKCQQKAGDVRGVAPLREKLRQKAGQNPQDYYFVGTVARLFAEANDVTTAQALVKLLPTASYRVYGYCYIADARSAQKDYVTARQMIAEANREMATLSDADQKSVRITVVQSQATAGDTKAARETARAKGTKIERSLAYLYLMETQLRAGDIAGAQQTLPEIEVALYREIGLVGIARIQLTQGDLTNAKATVAKAVVLTDKEQFSDYEAKRNLALVLGEVGETAEAKKRLASLKGKVIVAEVHVAIGEAQARAGDLKTAKAALQQAMGVLVKPLTREAETGEGESEESRVYALLKYCHAQGVLGDDTALRVALNGLTIPPDRVRGLLRYAGGRRMAKDKAGAEKYRAEAERLASSFVDARQRAVALIEVADYIAETK